MGDGIEERDDVARQAAIAYLKGEAESVVRDRYGVTSFAIRVAAQEEAMRLGAGNLREARQILQGKASPVGGESHRKADG